MHPSLRRGDAMSKESVRRSPGPNHSAPSSNPSEAVAFPSSIEDDMQRMYRMALRITKNREDAEDAVQQGLLNAFVHRDQFRGQSAFSTWLTRIAINEALC